MGACELPTPDRPEAPATMGAPPRSRPLWSAHALPGPLRQRVARLFPTVLTWPLGAALPCAGSVHEWRPRQRALLARCTTTSKRAPYPAPLSSGQGATAGGLGHLVLRRRSLENNAMLALLWTS